MKKKIAINAMYANMLQLISQEKHSSLLSTIILSNIRMGLSTSTKIIR